MTHPTPYLTRAELARLTGLPCGRRKNWPPVIKHLITQGIPHVVTARGEPLVMHVWLESRGQPTVIATPPRPTWSPAVVSGGRA